MKIRNFHHINHTKILKFICEDEKLEEKRKNELCLFVNEWSYSMELVTELQSKLLLSIDTFIVLCELEESILMNNNKVKK